MLTVWTGVGVLEEVKARPIELRRTLVLGVFVLVLPRMLWVTESCPTFPSQPCRSRAF